MGQCGSREVRARAPIPEKRDEYVLYEGPGPWTVCLPDAEVPPRFAPTGIASEKLSPPSTLMQLLTTAAKRHSDRPALCVERPVPAVVDGVVPPALPRESWTTWTYASYLADVRRVAKAFVSLGMERFESVNIWGFNAPEWVVASMAAPFAGGKSAGIYPTDTADTAAYKVVHSCGSIVVVEDRGKVERLTKALSERKDCTRLKAFVAFGFEPLDSERVPIAGRGEVPLLGWKALLALGDAADNEEELERRIQATKPGHCTALVYTSGTTGEPKAVMISHDNIVAEASSTLSLLSDAVRYACYAEQERLLSYLPLSHVAGYMVDIISPVFCTANKPAWSTTYFARPYDLREKTIRDRLCVVKPTIFLGVPLVWEKVADTVRAVGAQVTGFKKTLATWAKDLGLTYARSMQLGGDGSVPIGFRLADALILSKIKARLGLDECKFGFTGAAPIRVDTLEYFGSLGLSINEIYGMSETCGACTASTDQVHQWGSCGWEMAGWEVRVFTVDPENINSKNECPRSTGLDDTNEACQGELCFRGRAAMMGYMACPDFGADHLADIQKKTAEAVDADGWLHSGDKGMITRLGMVKITGRYKELIIGDGGENIAPVPIEDAVKKACDGIAEVMMVGDKRKYNVALVTLKAVGANGEVPGTDALDAGAKRVNPAVTKISEALDNKVWIDAVAAAINEANKNSKVCPNNTFKIQKFTILPTNFSEEGNELTPTKKLKRKVVEAKYLDTINRMYASEGHYVRYTDA